MYNFRKMGLTTGTPRRKAGTCGRTTMRKPQVAWSGVLDSRELRISSSTVTVDPATATGARGQPPPETERLPLRLGKVGLGEDR